LRRGPIPKDNSNPIQAAPFLIAAVRKVCFGARAMMFGWRDG
jgi:hypothetical protein